MQRDPNTGEMNDTTEVVIIKPPKPGSRKRSRLFFDVFNEDTESIELDIYLQDGTFKKRIFKGTIVPNGRFRYSSDSGERYELDEAKSIRAVLNSAVTTSQPRWYATWQDL